MSPANLPPIEVKELAYETMSTVLGLDPDSVDPEKEYRWVNRSSVKMARAKMKGYSLVKTDSGVTPLIEVDNAGDGTIVAGDLILMATDKEQFRERKNAQVQVALQRTQRAGEEVLERGKRLGVKTRVISAGDDIDEEDDD